MKKILKLAVLPGLIFFCVWRIRILWAHVHLTDAIVGETVNLAGGESYAGFGIGRNPVAEARTIPPTANGAQDQLVFFRSATIQDEGAVHVSVRTHNEADPHVQIVILNLQHRVRSEQGFRRADISTARQSEWLENGCKLGDMGGHAAQVLFQLGKRSAERNNALRGCGDAPSRAAAERDEQCGARQHLPGYRPLCRLQTPHHS